jgi:hypothetical protein
MNVFPCFPDVLVSCTPPPPQTMWELLKPQTVCPSNRTSLPRINIMHGTIIQGRMPTLFFVVPWFGAIPPPPPPSPLRFSSFLEKGQIHYTDKKKRKEKFPHILGNLEGSEAKAYIWLTTSYIRKPFLIYDFAPDPIWISLHMRKVLFSFLSVYQLHREKKYQEKGRRKSLLSQLWGGGGKGVEW